MHLLRLLRRPGGLFYSKETDRIRYKRVANTLLRSMRRRRDAFIANLPPVPDEWRIPRDAGFIVFNPETAARFIDATPVLNRCDEIAASGIQSVSKNKAYLGNFLLDLDISDYPEFVDFALKPALIACVADYLGELPVLTAIKFLHSQRVEAKPSGSQLYHCDHDDVRQVKLFMHVSDVDEEAGPLTVVPAWLSERIRSSKAYLFGGRQGHIADEHIRNGEVRSQEIPINGVRGTVALVDTAQVFHFGSRVCNKHRLLFFLQYVSITSFLFHPLTPLLPRAISKPLFGAYPYARLASPMRTRIQNAVLTGKVG